MTATYCIMVEFEAGCSGALTGGQVRHWVSSRLASSTCLKTKTKNWIWTCDSYLQSVISHAYCKPGSICIFKTTQYHRIAVGLGLFQCFCCSQFTAPIPGGDLCCSVDRRRGERSPGVSTWVFLLSAFRCCWKKTKKSLYSHLLGPEPSHVVSAGS